MIEIYQDTYKENEQPFDQAVRAIILENDKVYLMRFEDINMHVLPGGSVEKDESHIEALKREVLEETGYQVLRYNKKLVIREYYETMKREHHIYTVEVSKDKLPTNFTDEEKAYGMTLIKVPLEEAITLLDNGDKSKTLFECIQLREMLALLHHK